jgi:hypothetical protein
LPEAQKQLPAASHTFEATTIKILMNQKEKIDTITMVKL